MNFVHPFDPLANLTVLRLEGYLELRKQRAAVVAKREKLDAEIAQIDEKIRKIVSSSQSPKIRRGDIKGTILTVLTEAGKDGLHISEVASKTGFDRQTLDRFLYSRSARNTTGLHKLGSGRFRFVPPA
jgi:hypothetical protein